MSKEKSSNLDSSGLIFAAFLSEVLSEQEFAKENTHSPAENSSQKDTRDTTYSDKKALEINKPV